MNAIQKLISISDDDWTLLSESQTTDGVIAEYNAKCVDVDLAQAKKIAQDRFLDSAYFRAKTYKEAQLHNA